RGGRAEERGGEHGGKARSDHEEPPDEVGIFVRGADCPGPAGNGDVRDLIKLGPILAERAGQVKEPSPLSTQDSEAASISVARLLAAATSSARPAASARVAASVRMSSGAT